MWIEGINGWFPYTVVSLRLTFVSINLSLMLHCLYWRRGHGTNLNLNIFIRWSKSSPTISSYFVWFIHCTWCHPLTLHLSFSLLYISLTQLFTFLPSVQFIQPLRSFVHFYLRQSFSLHSHCSIQSLQFTHFIEYPKILGFNFIPKQ